MTELLAALRSVRWDGLPPNVVAWTAGIAAALVLLWFFIRPRPPRVLVSSHVLWDAVVPRRRNPLRRELLMLLLQLAMVVALAVALGDPRPEPVAEVTDAATAPTQRIHVLDTSLSMAARDGDLDRLRRVATAVQLDLDGLPPSVQVALVGAGAVPVLLAPFAADSARKRLALRLVRAAGVGADLEGALRLAVALPGFAAQQAHLELWTDDPAANKVAIAFSLAHAVPVTVRVPFAPADNLAVVAFALRAARGIPAEHEALVRVANPSPHVATAVLALETLDARLGEAPITLAPGEEIQRRYRFAPLPVAGVEAVLRDIRFVVPPSVDGATVADRPDALPDDDRAFAFAEPVRPVTAWLVSDGGRYLERALAVLPGMNVTRLTTQQYRDRRGAGADAVDVVFFDAFAPLPSRDGPLPPRSVLFAPPASRSPLPVAGTVQRPTVTDWALDHPLFEGLVLRDLQVERALVFAPEPDDARLLGSSAGPIALARARGATRTVVFGFALGESDLPLRLAFPQTIVNAVLWMRDARGWTEAEGRPHRLADPLYLTGGEAIIVDVAQETFAQAAGDRGAERRARLEVRPGEGPTPFHFPLPGLYEVRQDGGVAPYGVSLDTLEESRLSALPEGSAAPIAVPPSLPPAEGPAPIAPWLLLVALIVVLGVVEFGLYTR